MAKTKELAVSQQPINTELAKIAENAKEIIPLTKAQAHALAFNDSMIRYNELSNEYANLDKTDFSKANVKEAARLRNALVKVRTGAEEIKDVRKKTVLAESNVIQSFFNLVKDVCLLTESEIREFETELERQEQERRDRLKQQRLDLLLPYEVKNVEYMPLADMPEESFLSYMEDCKIGFEAKKAAAEKAEQDRIEAERIENERIEADRKEKEIFSSRWKLISKYAKYIPQTIIDSLGTISDDVFSTALNTAISLYNADIAKAEVITARAKELQPYIAFVSNYEALMNKSDQDYNAELLQLKESAEKQAALAKQHKEAQEKLNRLHEEQQKREADAKALETAPDVEKLREFYKVLKGIKYPVMEGDKSKMVVDQIRESIEFLLSNISDLAKELKS